MISLKDRAKHIAHAILSFFLIAYTHLREWWGKTTRKTSETIANLPWIHRFSRQRQATTATGSKPKRPTILGVVMAEKFAGTQHIQAIARILTWANYHDFEQIFLYEPSGTLQTHSADLQQQINIIDPHQRMALWTGWQPPSDIVTTTTATANKMCVAILSAADAEWPLTSVSSNGVSSIEQEQQQHLLLGDETNRAADRTTSLRQRSTTKTTKTPLAATATADIQKQPQQKQAALQLATAAPLQLKNHITTVAGPTAALEPDVVLVFGQVLTLAGYPPWAVRVSEIYPLGMLGAVTHSRLDGVLRRYKGTRQRFGR